MKFPPQVNGAFIQKRGRNLQPLVNLPGNNFLALGEKIVQCLRKGFQPHIQRGLHIIKH